ncbi:MAG: Stk1 family PASTA domain-containing Ser/Thr kinase [Lachnospiraceae bacterium]|nr:Stk1 family PASTA domain-containing Ser/Thr kinase [Lachnospiraceae bacterium]
MLKTGVVIGERYEIIEQIGTGGMSYVYKAKDHKLNRYVAVKVLKSEFSENKGFVSKFRVEAQAAAGLAHPNIVNVYDVGEDNGLHYIVMELVEGITLKEYIEKKARLSVKEAISIAIQVSMGIEAAHNNHIIHRDIKPQNIIISREGKVKVTDFGIARAATSNTITSNVMGSVHYTSPEQARGGYSDEKSDIYSLGITMFEMLTGRVPFNGETTVSVAIKHIQDEMPSPRDYVPEIPASVEQIIFKCTQKSPDRRYDNMSLLIADLKESLINPEAAFVQINKVDEEAATKMIREDEIREIRRTTRPAMVRENPEEEKGYVRRAERYVPEVEEEEEEDDELNPKMDKIVGILGIVAAAIICIVILVAVGKVLGVFGSKTPASENNLIPTQNTEANLSAGAATPTKADVSDDENMVEVPNIIGMTEQEAKDALNEKGLGFSLNGTIASDVIEEGLIANQDVEAGTMVEKNTRILGVLSSGKASFNVKDVTGKTEEEARRLLEEAELHVTTTESYDSSVGKGLVISMDPKAGTPVAKGDTISLVISKGSENAKVPNLYKMTEDAAKLALEAVGLKLGMVEETYSNSVAAGLVISQSYDAGTELEPGKTVNIVLSKGEEPAEVKIYRGSVNIQKPDGFIEGAVKFVLSQQVGDEIISRTYEAGILDETSFPYKLDMTGEPGISTGTVTVYVDEVAVGEKYSATFTPYDY